MAQRLQNAPELHLIFFEFKENIALVLKYFDPPLMQEQDSNL